MLGASKSVRTKQNIQSALSAPESKFLPVDNKVVAVFYGRSAQAR